MSGISGFSSCSPVLMSLLAAKGKMQGVRNRSSSLPKLCHGHLYSCPSLTETSVHAAAGFPAQAGFNRGFPTLWQNMQALSLVLWQHLHTCGMTDLVSIHSPLCRVQKGPSLYCSKLAMADNSKRSRCACQVSGRDGATEKRSCLAFVKDKHVCGV